MYLVRHMRGTASELGLKQLFCLLSNTLGMQNKIPLKTQLDHIFSSVHAPQSQNWLVSYSQDAAYFELSEGILVLSALTALPKSKVKAGFSFLVNCAIFRRPKMLNTSCF